MSISDTGKFFALIRLLYDDLDTKNTGGCESNLIKRISNITHMLAQLKNHGVKMDVHVAEMLIAHICR
jgi:hypothetical protein